MSSLLDIAVAQNKVTVELTYDPETLQVWHNAVMVMLRENKYTPKAMANTADLIVWEYHKRRKTMPQEAPMGFPEIEFPEPEKRTTFDN
jgi:hypothetical protein